MSAPRMSLVTAQPMVRWMPLGLSFAFAVVGACTVVRGGGPLPMVGQPAASYEGLTLLMDPLERAPVALLLDATDRLPPGRRSLTLLGIQDDSVSVGLPRFRVTDALPEFWAEPAVWQHFRLGRPRFPAWDASCGPRIGRAGRLRIVGLTRWIMGCRRVGRRRHCLRRAWGCWNCPRGGRRFHWHGTAWRGGSMLWNIPKT